MAQDDGKSDALQMIDGKGDFSSDFEEFAMGVGSDDQLDENLVFVTALGVRGSGKSLLLNDVFGTSFEVEKAFSSGKGTKGLWVQAPTVSTAKPLVVMNAQGSDGRGAEVDNVNRIATFTLCFSDVIMFNLWYADIGRYEAAGYGMIKTIFHEYLKLYSQEERQTLFQFIIRDHDDGTSLGSLMTILENDLREIWDQVTKPRDCENMAMDHLFRFQFISMPHMRHRKSDFDRALGDLKRRFFDPSHPSYALKSEYSKMIPVNAFGKYPAVTWQDLAKDGGSEQPSRRDLVAAYRCDVAYHAQHSIAAGQLNRWTGETEKGKVVNRFGAEASKLLSQRMEGYEAATSMHASSSYRIKKENELNTFLRSSIQSLFQKQITLLRVQSMQRFKDHLLSNVLHGLRNQTAAMNGVLDWFSGEAEGLVVPEMHLSFHQQKTNLQEALSDYAQRFEDSPTVQLTAMQRYERRAQRPSRRQPDARLSLNLTGALRPRGFGNFQLVSGYSDGPLAMNFSVCNDADAAEQEGHGRVPLFKLQPTLQYDLDL